VGSCPAKILATCLQGEKDEAFKKLIEKCLGNKYSEVRAEKDSIDPASVTEANLRSVYRKMIVEARKLEESGKFKLPQKEVENISKDSATGVQKSGNSATTIVSSANPNKISLPGTHGENSLDQTCPTVDTFQMESPPAGLVGERFVRYLDGIFKK
jgi:hypothetical protein